MNSYQKAKFNSYQLIVIEKKLNPQIAAIIPYFAQGVDQLAALLPEIESLSVTQSQDLTGITEDKNDLADQVIDHLIEVSGRFIRMQNRMATKPCSRWWITNRQK